MELKEKINKLSNNKLKLAMANGEGRIFEDRPYKVDMKEGETLDYFILFGTPYIHTIYRFILKLSVGGILVAEVTNKSYGVAREIVNFLNNVARQHAALYLIDGAKYIFVVRLDS